jgi:hypothetical protein
VSRFDIKRLVDHGTDAVITNTTVLEGLAIKMNACTISQALKQDCSVYTTIIPDKWTGVRKNAIDTCM